MFANLFRQAAPLDLTDLLQSYPLVFYNFVGFESAPKGCETYQHCTPSVVGTWRSWCPRYCKCKCPVYHNAHTCIFSFLLIIIYILKQISLRHNVYTSSLFMGLLCAIWFCFFFYFFLGIEISHVGLGHVSQTWDDLMENIPEGGLQKCGKNFP